MSCFLNIAPKIVKYLKNVKPTKIMIAELKYNDALNTY